MCGESGPSLAAPSAGAGQVSPGVRRWAALLPGALVLGGAGALSAVVSCSPRAFAGGGRRLGEADRSR